MMETIRLARKNLPLIALLGALFALVTGLAIFIIRSETERNRLLMESDASRSASLLLEVFFEQGITEDPDLLEGIVGFGIYGSSGSSLLSVGSAPQNLRSFRGLEQGQEYLLDREKGTLIHVRTIARGRTESLFSPGLLERLASRYLYIEINVAAYLRQQAFYNTALAAVPLAIAALTILAGFFALKNADYREKIAAQERLARLGEAARTLAHELKNPLNVIKLRARLARKDVGPEAAADLDVVEEEVERLAGLTDRIREFLQDARGKPEHVELQELLRDLISRSAWNATVSTDGRAGYTVSFDPSRLRSVLENLIRNAQESTPPRPDGSPAPPAEILLRRERDAVILSVLDRGSGIPKADVERVFDPFYTTKVTGSGIGLSITRRFVEAAGGRVELVQRPGGGTEARITLNAVEEEQ